MFRRLLRSTLAWRLTGLTYRTSVVATRGHYENWNEYIAESHSQMLRIPIDFGGKTVLEFGCGLGGNLLAISNRIRRGIGIDINGGYVRIARRRAAKEGIRNLTFLKSKARELPSVPIVDEVLSIGVFERLPKSVVRKYVQYLAGRLKSGGNAALYFLTPRAPHTDFVRKLGSDAYVCWSDNEIGACLLAASLDVASVIRWNQAANLYVAVKVRTPLAPPIENPHRTV
jgi:SAM-dependent methyltransferase